MNLCVMSRLLNLFVIFSNEIVQNSDSKRATHLTPFHLVRSFAWEFIIEGMCVVYFIFITISIEINLLKELL